MFNLLAFLTSLSAICMVVAGSLAYLRNPKQSLNRYFFLLTITLGLWVPANFLDSNLARPALTQFLVKIDFSLAIFIAWFTLFFAMALTRKITDFRLFRSRGFFFGSLAINSIVVLLILSGNVVSTGFVSGNLVVTNEELFPLFILTFLTYVILGLGNFLVAYLKTKKGERQTLSLIFAGFLVAAIANILSNIIFPQLFSSRAVVKDLNVIGYLGILTLVITTYLAITAQRLFDIRLVIARSLAYVLSLSFLTGLFAAFTYLLTNTITSTTGRAVLLKNVLSTILIVATALSYSSLKRFFDRITNRFFYQDAYDGQQLLNELNNVLVTAVDVEPLLEQCINVLEENIKASFAVFSIRETSYVPRRQIGSQNKKLSPEDMDVINKQTTHIHHKIIIADELGSELFELHKILNENDISIVVRLVSTIDYEVEGVGYLLLGPKKSGNIFNKQDINILEIVGNELVIAIQNALRFEEIEKFNVTLQDKVDQATRKLQRTNEKLKQMDETKDEFISMASHQLRTPLTSVKGYLSMVLEGDAGDVNEMQHKLLEQAFISSQRMVYLIADLLNVSRLRTGKFVIEPVISNLAEAVEGEVHQLQETAEARGLTLRYHKPENFPKLMLDETKIRQVVMNFMDNAIYYSQEGGHIDVELKDKGDTIEYTVTDDGIGVPKAEQHHLFTKFYRAANAKKARPDGTGLGLFMAKKVVVAQGGNVIFKSEQGKGSVFGFSFQKAKLQALANAEGADMHQAAPDPLAAVIPEPINAKVTEKVATK